MIGPGLCFWGSHPFRPTHPRSNWFCQLPGEMAHYFTHFTTGIYYPHGAQREPETCPRTHGRGGAESEFELRPQSLESCSLRNVPAPLADEEGGTDPSSEALPARRAVEMQVGALLVAHLLAGIRVGCDRNSRGWDRGCGPGCFCNYASLLRRRWSVGQQPLGATLTCLLTRPPRTCVPIQA